MRPWMTLLLMAAAAAPQPASAVESRELTTFVYPQSANNTYRLPQYRLKGRKAAGLSRCGDAASAGLRFEPDGQTFHLDPPPARNRSETLRRSIRVQRGKSDCFKADIVVVVPLLGDPDPATWTVSWSPDRPDAIDVIVPSTELANDAGMQAAHRIVFPWNNRALAGAWVDCATGCTWRVPADSAVRRDFLTRAKVPIRVEAIAVTGIGASAGVFNPANGAKRPPPKVVELAKWQISPDISRRINVGTGQTEVPLTFPGAWAIKPSPKGTKGAQVLHTPAGPVLRFSDPKKIKPFDLTPGAGQLKAYLKLDVSDRRRRFLTYVASFGNTSARLPPGIQICDPGPTSIVKVGAVPASSLPMPFIESGGQCGQRGGRRVLAVTLLDPVLRAQDVSAVALDWSPKERNRLDIYLKSKALVQSSAIREDTELVVGDHPPGKFVGCFSDYCQYRIEGLTGAGDLVAPPIRIVSKRMQAEQTPPLDARTGKPFETQRVESGAWRVKDAEMIVGLPFLDGDRRATGTINDPVARFFRPGPVACAVEGTCIIDPNEGDMAVTVEGRGALKVGTVSVPSVAMDGVSLIHIRGEIFRPVTPRLRLKMSTCRYEIRQLTRAVAGLNEASVLFRAKLRPGSSEFCPGQDWTATLASGERGHGQLARGLLEVYLESVPVPEGGSGDVAIEFAYPSGQKVKVEGGAKLSIEPAPLIGAPRVSVRLPGGDLRPLPATLATHRPNILYFDTLSDPDNWRVEVARARSLYRPCRGDAEIPAVGDDASVDYRDDESYGSYCLIPTEKTNDTLKLRFVRAGPTSRLLRQGVDPSLLPDEEQARFRRAGWVEVETSRPAQPWSIAMDLVPRTEMVCGTRVIRTSAGTTPRAVNYDDFDTCVVRVQLGAPARIGPPDRTPLEDTIDFYGEQKIEVRGRVVGGDDNSGTTVLTTVRLRAETKDQEVLIIPVALSEIGTNPPQDYAVVEVEVAHSANFYAADDKWSLPSSVARLRIRRGPEYLAWWSDTGRGVRMFGAFTATPFSLFRFPHSGKNATDSQTVDRLEAATAALGIAGIIEAWNFDYNESVIPVINPQLQIGALISSNPTQGDLSLPGVSLVAGIGLRTGVGTNPGSTLETALKTVIWYEMLFQRDGRGNDPSHNLLFGFTVDLGSTPN